MLRRSLLTLALLAFSAPAFAGDSSQYAGLVKGVALGGYDATSYFSGKPLKGSKTITQKWQDVTWRFSSEANRVLFAASPEKYAPQYNGHCAFAAANGALASGDPTAWTVHNDKLYINYSPDVRQMWSEDIDGYVSTADKNWPGLIAK